MCAHACACLCVAVCRCVCMCVFETRFKGLKRRLFAIFLRDMNQSGPAHHPNKDKWNKERVLCGGENRQGTYLEPTQIPQALDGLSCFITRIPQI